MMVKAEYRDLVALVRDKLSSLPTASPLRQALMNPCFEQSLCAIEKTNREDNVSWPATFGFLLHLLREGQPEAIDDFDRDLTLVLQHTPALKVGATTQFLLSKTSDPASIGMWYGRLFDVWIRAVFLKSGLNPEFDVKLPNGLDSDVRVKIKGHWIRIENVIISEGKLRKKREEAMRTRCLQCINIYSRPRRIYQKVYEKIARDLDPKKGQCSECEPNVLMLSFNGPDMNPTNPGWTWALDILFNAHMDSFGGNARNENTDISLRGWLSHYAEDLCRRNQLTEDDFDARYERLIYAPNKLGGIMLFQYCRLVLARVNYNALQACRISHGEMVELERLLGARPSYSLA